MLGKQRNKLFCRLRWALQPLVWLCATVKQIDRRLHRARILAESKLTSSIQSDTNSKQMKRSHWIHFPQHIVLSTCAATVYTFKFK